MTAVKVDAIRTSDFDKAQRISEFAKDEFKAATKAWKIKRRS